MYKFLKQLKRPGRHYIGGYLLEKEDGTTIEVTRREMIREVYAGNVKGAKVRGETVAHSRYLKSVWGLKRSLWYDEITPSEKVAKALERFTDLKIEDAKYFGGSDKSLSRGLTLEFDGVNELLLGPEYIQRAKVLSGGNTAEQDRLPLEIKAKLLFGVTGGLRAVWNSGKRELEEQGYTLGYIVENPTANQVKYGTVVFEPYEQKEIWKSDIAEAVNIFEPSRFANGVVARHVNTFDRFKYSHGLATPGLILPTIQCGELVDGEWKLKEQYEHSRSAQLALSDKYPIGNTAQKP